MTRSKFIIPKVKCPVCPEGYRTTTKNPNIMNHIKAIAKTELLTMFLLSRLKKRHVHADYLKKHFKILEARKVLIIGSEILLTVKNII